MAWMCLDLNTWVLSSMPAYLVNAAPSLDAGWLTNPDPDIYSSWEEFCRSLFWDLWTGEAFVLITARYATGWPARFHVVEPWMVDVEIGADGLRHYKIGNVPVPRDDIIHLRYRATAAQARGSVRSRSDAPGWWPPRCSTATPRRFVGAGAIPNAVLTHPERLTAEQAAELQGQWVQSRMTTMGLPAVLSGGVQFETVQQSPAQMGLVELAQMTD